MESVPRSTPEHWLVTRGEFDRALAEWMRFRPHERVMHGRLVRMIRYRGIEEIVDAIEKLGSEGRLSIEEVEAAVERRSTREHKIEKSSNRRKTPTT